MSKVFRFVFLCLLSFSVMLPASGQLGLGGLGKKKAAAPSDKAPELTDADKQKMAEIERRPEVQAAIRDEWDAKRREDLNYAFIVNTSSRYASGSVSQALEFREKYDQLYDNPILQRYLNNIGQRLVPRDSPNVFAFRLLLDPTPRAEALSTGTVYVSTGLVALLDNEAQLSYVLAHEIAHVERNHEYNAIKNRIVQEELNKDKEHDAAKKQAILTTATTLLGAGIGAKTGSPLLGAGIGFLGGSIAGNYLFRAKTTVTEWSELNENEADEAALPYMLSQNYDAREIPRLFTRMASLTTRDSRAGLGFIARPERVKVRNSHMQELLSGSVKAQIDAKLKAGGLTASSPEFPLLMAALKRDNGIIALDQDLFAMSRDSLEDAVALRSNDALAHLYLGKVISMTARTAEDRQQGMNHYLKAIQYDENRGAYPDPHLERAIDMIAQNNPAQQGDIRKELQLYVALYQRENRGALPANMPILYDYMQLAGDMTWYVAPTTVISTKYAEAIHVTSGGSTGAASIRDLTVSAEVPVQAPASSDQKTAPAKVVKKTVSTSKTP